MSSQSLFLLLTLLIPRAFPPSGVLKDYLRELPHPLISKPLYEAVLDAMSKRPLMIGNGGCENDPADSERAVGLLETLPEVEKVLETSGRFDILRFSASTSADPHRVHLGDSSTLSITSSAQVDLVR